MKQHIVLAGCGYNVTVQDRQVIFEEHGIYGCYTCFVFERPIEINNSGGIWYLTHFASNGGKVPASHLIAAHKYCCEEFGASFEAYKGALTL